MKVSSKGRSLIREFEGCKLTSYRCPAGVWTVGVGHTGSDVKPGMKITEEQADELLRRDLIKFETLVEVMVKVPVTQGQFDALVSFAFNCGTGNLAKSTLLKRVNAKDFDEAANEFPKWNRAGGKVLPGLTRRRLAEQQLFKS